MCRTSPGARGYAAAALDAADGVMDGRFYGRPIVERSVARCVVHQIVFQITTPLEGDDLRRAHTLFGQRTLLPLFARNGTENHMERATLLRMGFRGFY